MDKRDLISPQGWCAQCHRLGVTPAILGRWRQRHDGVAQRRHVEGDGLQ
jgi:hypothetical protein